MGVSYVYKKFTPKDKAIIPFNAHKQYNFTKTTAANNSIAYYSASYTSESISLYSSASSIYGGDTINNIKYNQIDHLFYRDYLKKFGNKKDPIDYLKQRRELYKRLNILSIPSGLSGHEIKKSTFLLSASKDHEIVDDSYGNLLISGTNINNYPNDVQQNVFRLGPIEGYKKYDLGVFDDYAIVSGREIVPGTNFQYIHKEFYRRGHLNPNAPTTYTTNNERYPKGYYPKDEDDSYFFNEVKYNNVTFQEAEAGLSTTSDRFSSINFNSATSSYIEVPHNSRFNFNNNEDFCISFYITPQYTQSSLPSNPLADSSGNAEHERRFILGKSTTKTVIAPGLSSSVFVHENEGPQFPFEIYMQSQSIYFERSDGTNTQTGLSGPRKNFISGSITSSATGISHGTFHHVLCQVTSSVMELWHNGKKIASATNNLTDSVKNKASLWIGSKGIPSNLTTDNTGLSRYRSFNGTLNNINIWSTAFSETQIKNISESVNASPYVGNIFYQSGFATITHPKYMGILSGSNSEIEKLQFQGSHLIHEHEYQCTIQEHEFNLTTNISARKKTGTNPFELADFTTSSYFTPHVTTIGLYNEGYELLAIAKLGQPIKMSEETDTTFIVRWDT